MGMAEAPLTAGSSVVVGSLAHCKAAVTSDKPDSEASLERVCVSRGADGGGGGGGTLASTRGGAVEESPAGLERRIGEAVV